MKLNNREYEVNKNKDERKASAKAYYEAHKEQYKAYYQAHRQEIIAKKKAYGKVYYQANKEEKKASVKAWREANKEQYNVYQIAYQKSDVNSFGESKNSIRTKSRRILKQMNLHIDGYEIHHCFTYDDPAKFIYISRSLHLKIHQFLRDNNIDAGKDHWMSIRDLVNSSDEFMYIMC